MLFYKSFIDMVTAEDVFIMVEIVYISVFPYLANGYLLYSITFCIDILLSLKPALWKHFAAAILLTSHPMFMLVIPRLSRI